MSAGILAHDGKRSPGAAMIVTVSQDTLYLNDQSDFG